MAQADSNNSTRAPIDSTPLLPRSGRVFCDRALGRLKKRPQHGAPEPFSLPCVSPRGPGGDEGRMPDQVICSYPSMLACVQSVSRRVLRQHRWRQFAEGAPVAIDHFKAPQGFALRGREAGNKCGPLASLCAPTANQVAGQANCEADGDTHQEAYPEHGGTIA
jgi:hypothetical protein